MYRILFYIYAAIVGAFAHIIGYPVMTHPIEFLCIVIPLNFIGSLVYLWLDDN